MNKIKTLTKNVFVVGDVEFDSIEEANEYIQKKIIIDCISSIEDRSINSVDTLESILIFLRDNWITSKKKIQVFIEAVSKLDEEYRY